MGCLLPAARCCCYPTTYLAWLLSCPVWAPYRAAAALMCPPPPPPAELDTTAIKPPVG